MTTLETVSPAWQEKKLNLRHLRMVAGGKLLSDGQGQPTLALHGWLDNANSFDHIAAHLKNRPLFSMDWLGHGQSEHFRDSHSYQMMDYVTQIFDAADALGWQKFHILGHSLGAAVGLLACGLFPERILSFVSIDSFGPLTAKPEEVPSLCRAHLAEKEEYFVKTHRGFATLEEGAKLRARLTNVDYNSALTLAKRGLSSKLVEGERLHYFWSHDFKLQVKTAVPLTEEHVISFIKEVTCPVLFIEASQGLMAKYGNLVQQRLVYLKNLKQILLAGSHHLHMENIAEVSQAINTFWQN